MSWRETLGIAEPAEQSDAQNPHNTQKPVEGAICADIADSAHRDSEQEASKLLEALADACKGLDITPTEVKEAPPHTSLAAFSTLPPSHWASPLRGPPRRRCSREQRSNALSFHQ